MQKIIKSLFLSIGLIACSKNINAMSLTERAKAALGNSFWKAINHEQLIDRVKRNNKRDFQIVAAYYGTDDQYKDVTAIVDTYGKKGILLIPANMNSAFGNPSPNKKKTFVIAFKPYHHTNSRPGQIISFDENCIFSHSGDQSRWNKFKNAYPANSPSDAPFWIDKVMPHLLTNSNNNNSQNSGSNTESSYTIPSWINSAGYEQAHPQGMDMNMLKELGKYCRIMGQSHVTDYVRYEKYYNGQSQGFETNNSEVRNKLNSLNLEYASVQSIKEAIKSGLGIIPQYSWANLVDHKNISIRFKVYANGMNRYFSIENIN